MGVDICMYLYTNTAIKAVNVYHLQKFPCIPSPHFCVRAQHGIYPLTKNLAHNTVSLRSVGYIHLG